MQLLTLDQQSHLLPPDYETSLSHRLLKRSLEYRDLDLEEARAVLTAHPNFTPPPIESSSPRINVRLNSERPRVEFTITPSSNSRSSDEPEIRLQLFTQMVEFAKRHSLKSYHIVLMYEPPGMSTACVCMFQLLTF